MDGDSSMRLLYLVLLGLAVAGYFFAEGRQKMSKTLQQAAIWGLIFVGFVAGYGLWSDLRSTVSPRQAVFGEEGRIELPRASDGHFYLTADVNGQPIEFMVDTGATNVVLTMEAAAALGFGEGDLRFTGIAYTANGEVPIAPIKLSEIRVGDLVDTDIRAAVNGGELDTPLLGMDYLDRFERIEIQGDRLVLTR
jgi:aspartyl protease family protein